MTTSNSLPLTETLVPATQGEAADVMRRAVERREAIYPLGGETSLEFGLPAKTSGVGVSLRGLARVIDYPARDLTITVEAGITLGELSRTLAAERQWLPIDAPHTLRATLGGLIATNWSGPRRFGQGTIRDYVLGVSAIDGAGRPFQGGGRVVKNVAGYDFCKLLTGSLGTLGVITQATLKVKPLPAASALVQCDLPTLDAAETVLAALVQSATTPTAIELVAGPEWLGSSHDKIAARLIVGLEGTAAEVAWMIDTLPREWSSSPATGVEVLREPNEVAALWQRLIDFSAAPGAHLAVKASLRPSAVTRLVQTAREIDPRASVQAHAGSGVVVVRFTELPAGGVSKHLLGRLYPIATSAGGNCVVLSTQLTSEITPQIARCGSDIAVDIMRSVRQQFDPHGLLNPGRFVG